MYTWLKWKVVWKLPRQGSFIPRFFQRRTEEEWLLPAAISDTMQNSFMTMSPMFYLHRLLFLWVPRVIINSSISLNSHSFMYSIPWAIHCVAGWVFYISASSGVQNLIIIVVLVIVLILLALGTFLYLRVRRPKKKRQSRLAHPDCVYSFRFTPFKFVKVLVPQFWDVVRTLTWKKR